MKNKKSFRDIDGIILLDKPQFMTSNAALQQVKRIFSANKAGHTGSLDPLASGMLPICLGEATKFSQFLLDAHKCYRVTGKLGIKTTTGDAEGEIIDQKPIPQLNEAMLEAVLKQFRGEIQQVPSMFSALKYQGRPLYELARQGITIDRPARPVSIFKLELLSYDSETLSLEITCSKGTYIRTLIEDIGQALGCGAHVIALRRLFSGQYQEQEMISLERLTELAQQGYAALDSLLQPIESAVKAWPELHVSEVIAFYLRRGQPVAIPYSPPQGWVSLILKPNHFLGVGEVLEDGRVAPRRLILR